MWCSVDRRILADRTPNAVRRPVAAVALLLALVGPASGVGARAAVASTISYDGVSVRYVAGPGEANQVVASIINAPSSSRAFAVDIIDEGAAITPGSGCETVNAHTARCIGGDFTMEFNVVVDAGDLADTITMTVPDVYLDLGFRVDPWVRLQANGGDGDDTLHATQYLGSSTNGTPAADRGDELSGGAGDDEIWGSPGPDQLDGGPGNDVIWGGDDGDWIKGGGGTDSLYGEAGDDFLEDGDLAAGEQAPGPDLLDGGDGVDIVSYQGRSNPVLVDLRRSSSGEAGEGDQAIAVEGARGGNGDDVLRAGNPGGYLYGDRGDDRLIAGNEGNELDGGAGSDRLVGRRGADSLSGGTGDDALLGGAGNDGLDGGPGRDQIFAGQGDDGITGSAGDDVLRCGSGRDEVSTPRRNLVAASCERIAISTYIEDRFNAEDSGGWSMSVAPTPTWDRSPSLVARLTCVSWWYAPDAYADSSSGLASPAGTLRIRSSRGTLARAVIPRQRCGKGLAVLVPASLTPLGQVVGRGSHGVLATLTLNASITIKPLGNRRLPLNATWKVRLPAP